MSTNISIALIAAGVIGLLCVVTGIAMIYEPAALLVLGVAIVAVSLLVAYARGSSS